MVSSLKEISKIPSVTNVSKMTVDKELMDYLGEKYTKIARTNFRQINAYRFTYRSNGDDVIGYIVEPKKGDRLPIIVYNRGGSGDYGKIEKWKAFFTFADFAKRGYIVIASQYAGNDGGTGIDEMGGRDLANVLDLYKILKNYSRADSSRIGMIGESRGGMMTLLALKKKVPWVKAAVLCSPLVDLPGDKVFRPKMLDHYKKMFGGGITEMKQRSALYWVDKIQKNTPILILTGSSDWRVNPVSVIELSQKMLIEKIPHRLVVFEGADHSLTEFRNEVDKQIYDWLDRYVREASAKKINLTPHGK